MQGDARVFGQPCGDVGVFGEWPGGIAPPGSRGTVRESLDSYGSHGPALGEWEKMPMGKESGLVLSYRVQPGPGLGGFPAQSFEFLHGPANEMLVDVPC